jgi:excinuclease ABC subunit A
MNDGDCAPRIELRGVRVHNLQNIDLDIPLGQLIVVTGVSGSGKSSLAFDTLYAEGQRRYVESFSNDSRRFLERFEKPDADRIEPIPPAIAVRQKTGSRSRRATVGTATEIYDSLRLLFARVGVIECPRCRRRVERHTPASAQTVLAGLASATRFMICFPIGAKLTASRAASQPGIKPVWPGLERSAAPGSEGIQGTLASHPIRVNSDLIEAGFTRLIIGGTTVAVSDAGANFAADARVLVVVDRLTAGTSIAERLADSLELAFRHGDGACVVLVPRGTGVARATPAGSATPQPGTGETAHEPGKADPDRLTVDGGEYDILSFNSRLICPGCGTEFADPEPALFNFNSPLGACPDCRGIGERAADAQSPQVCPACQGARLRPEALAVHVAGRTIIELTRLTAAELLALIRESDKKRTGSELISTSTKQSDTREAPVPVLSDVPGPDDDRHERQRQMSEQILTLAANRLEFLINVGLGYLTLDRLARTLSGGEAQRVRLTAIFGAKFVNMLCVLDEPTTGLHPRDTERLLAAIQRLRDAGNTVVVVEHDATVIRQADQVLDIGPGAGRDGGRVVFQGTPQELASNGESATADFLSGRRQFAAAASCVRRSPTGWLRIAGVEHHNLRDVAVDFPLGVLCVVTGVSGSGKSSLVEETLHPAVVAGLRARFENGDSFRAENLESRETARRARCLSPFSNPTATGRYASLTGLDQIDNIVLIDQSPLGRSARANPVSFLNLFGEIRTLFAETAEAKIKNFSARHFSFNFAGGGRCETCRGTGTIAVDMQFLPDVVTTCPDCHGARYRREILEARYRGLSIAEVLALTVRDAFPFFRGRTRLQRRLKVLKDVGLDYITLGQPANTLSGGESQRLKLAAFLARASRSRTLFVVDEPTSGLHPADVARLMDGLGQILAGGHSLIVIEHNLDFLRSADYLIDLGPGAGPAGGRIIAAGTPEEIARVPESITGMFLEEELSEPRSKQ